ncbi:F0F1 ATP synthase subunit A [Elusimicrobiota bacterium]
MDFNAVLAHHLLDHTFLPLFKIGPVQFSLTKHLIMMWLVSGFLVVTLTYAARGRSRAALLMRTGVEAVVLYVRDEIVDPSMGHEGRKYLHYFLTLFFFILCCNLAGLIPLSSFLEAVKFPWPNMGGTVTGNIAVTAGLAVCTLGLIILGGVRAQGGVLPFLRHFLPLPPETNILIKVIIGGCILFPIEILGVFVKCGALTLRLFVNMIAGHCVALGFMSMIFIFGAVSATQGMLASVAAISLVTFVNVLEVLIALLQAFIFTLLSAVFVGLVSQHGH